MLLKLSWQPGGICPWSTLTDRGLTGKRLQDSPHLPSPMPLFYSFPYCKLSVINSCFTVYLQIVMLLLERNAQPELPDCEGRYFPFVCWYIILSKQLYTAFEHEMPYGTLTQFEWVLWCECHIIKHYYARYDVSRPCSKIKPWIQGAQ